LSTSFSARACLLDRRIPLSAQFLWSKMLWSRFKTREGLTREEVSELFLQFMDSREYPSLAVEKVRTE